MNNQQGRSRRFLDWTLWALLIILAACAVCFLPTQPVLAVVLAACFGLLLGQKYALRRQRVETEILVTLAEEEARLSSEVDAKQLYLRKTEVLRQAIERERRSNLGRIARHPLIGIVAAAVVGSFLLPAILAQHERKKALRQEKVRQAIEVIKASTEVNQKLTSMRTALELFHKYATSKYRVQQEDLRQEMKRLYADFDQQAWWWHWAVRENAKLQKLIEPSQHQELGDKLQLYTENLRKSGDVLEELWMACLSERYRPKDPKVQAIMEDVRKKLSELGTQRNTYVSEVCQMFALDDETTATIIQGK